MTGTAASRLFPLVLLLGCREQTSELPPILVQKDLYSQQKYKPQGYSLLFGDHAAMRPPAEGSVPQEGFEDDEGVATGVLADGTSYVLALPESVVSKAGGLGKMVKRGRERFEIYCAPCHGRTGDGKGMVARVPGGFAPLPNLHDEAVRQMPDGQMFATITNGVRNMPPYGAAIPAADRWAIVAYVRALELSQLGAGGSK